jgi:tetratricopeptide (TPR) repeat protein
VLPLHPVKLFAITLALTGCFGRGSVTRIADGELIEGRYIRGEAYAAYLRATIRDQSGDRRGALEALDEALAQDPRSPEIFTLMGEIHCRAPLGESGTEPGLSALERATSLDPTYAPAWLARARCLEAAGELEAALEAALEAITYEPERAETTEVVARLLMRSRRKREAFVWLDALVTLAPNARDAHEVMLRAALQARDTTRELRARRALSHLAVSHTKPSLPELDVALAEGDLARARRLAGELSLRPAALSLYAVPRAPATALAQARLLLAADPENSDAFAAALAAADLLGDEAEFARLLGALAETPDPASPGALEALRQVLARRSGAEAASSLAPGTKPEAH